MNPSDTKFVSVFGGKGGVGKSLLTILLADYLSSAEVKTQGQENRKFKVLVLDMDDQCSAACHLLGEERVSIMGQKKLSLPDVLPKMSSVDSLYDWLPPVINCREAQHSNSSRIKTLGRVDVIHSFNSNRINHFLTNSSAAQSRTIAKNLRQYFSDNYDIVLIDLPSSNMPNDYSLIGMFLAENFFVPTSCSALEVLSFPRTFELLENLKIQKGDDFAHTIHGLVFNMVDKRSKTWKKRKNEIESIARDYNLNKTYSIHFNFNHSLMNASLYDGVSLKAKFATVSEKTRLLAIKMLFDLGLKLQ